MIGQLQVCLLESRFTDRTVTGLSVVCWRAGSLIGQLPVWFEFRDTRPGERTDKKRREGVYMYP